jgi:DNA-binding beta-propeller fold protein YncE
MASAINEIDMEFEEIKNVNIETIGSLSQITRPCPIKYKSMKVQHPQVQHGRRQTGTEFIKEGEVNLKHGEKYWLADMAVTSDNKLLLCNWKSSHVYIYKDYKTYEDKILFTSSPPDCITVVPCTDKAVVTLPLEHSIQFINTTNNTKDKKIEIGEWCNGVTAVKDKIYLGGYSKVLILNTDGSRVSEITTDGGHTYNLLYNERNDQLLLRQSDRLCCINLDGHVIYRYDISGHRGLAVDQQGHVYISGRYSNDIQRLSPDGTFRDIVLSKHDGVDEPLGITFNNDFTKLFIINRDGKTVLVFL